MLFFGSFGVTTFFKNLDFIHFDLIIIRNDNFLVILFFWFFFYRCRFYRFDTVMHSIHNYCYFNLPTLPTSLQTALQSTFTVAHWCLLCCLLGEVAFPCRCVKRQETPRIDSLCQIEFNALGILVVSWTIVVLTELWIWLLPAEAVSITLIQWVSSTKM